MRYESTGNISVNVGINKLIYQGKTRIFDEILIAKNQFLGTFLVINGKVQSSQRDEYIYHESSVLAGMLCAKWGLRKENNSKVDRILVIGSGPGGHVRELLKYSEIQEIVWVDIDKELVDICSSFLPYSLKVNDQRVKFVAEDGYTYAFNLLNKKEKFNLIIIDVNGWDVNPVSQRIVEPEFYKIIKKLLYKNGVLVTFAKELPIDNVFNKTIIDLNDVLSVFKHTYPFHIYMPSMGRDFPLTLATDIDDFLKIDYNFISSIISEFKNTFQYIKYDNECFNSFISMFSFDENRQIIPELK
jgi:spermidine synthase